MTDLEKRKMKTVLVVEDEKMIRQGIKTMIQRSGVPVEVIMECNNGETALEILQEQKIDVMFTDIRMPKMDGIELVRKMQNLEHKPLTVAISGYDDFSYAVEMMRHGVREYILKPVERQKIQTILQKLEKEIADSKKNDSASRKIGYQQFKYLMLNTRTTEEELNTLREQYEKNFYEGNFYVCCGNIKNGKEVERYIYLPDMDENDVIIIEGEKLEMLLKNELSSVNAGVSAMHQGMGELRAAYVEAEAARHRAFCTNREVVRADEDAKRIPEQMLEEARKLLEPEACLQRVQLLGTDKTDEVLRVWNAFFHATKLEHLTDAEFLRGIAEFLSDVAKTYRNVIGNDGEQIEKLRNIWKYANLDTYEEEFMDWLLELHDKINRQFDTNKNKQKIQQAVEYIKKNYAKDLNMAVVSNYISMNYSLFSYSFKQYTGSNFVNYLKTIRMEEAKKLLAETDMRVIEISQEVGYDNEKHFMKIFKSAYGVSPSEYRKNMKMTE